MADIKKISLTTDINIDTLKAKLKYLYSCRTNGEYTKADMKAGFDLLEEYWKHKNSTNREEAQRFFDSLVDPLWKMIKPEVQAVLLEDMMINANYSTEYFLFKKDKEVQEMKSNFLKNTNGSSDPSLRFFPTTTIFSSGNVANEHLFGLVDFGLIRDYIFDATFKKYGFTNMSVDMLGGELDGIRRKYFAITQNKKFDRIIAMIYGAQNMEHCMEIGKQSKHFTEEAFIKNIRDCIKDPYDRRKMIIAQDPKATLARSNLLEHIMNNPKEFKSDSLDGLSNDTYVEMLMLDEQTLYNSDLNGLKPEIDKACRLIEYSDPEEPDLKPLPFYVITDYVLKHMNKEKEGFREVSELELKRLFINYAFGNFDKKQRDIMRRYYVEASNYHKLMEEEIEDSANYEVVDVDIERGENYATTEHKRRLEDVPRKPRKKIMPFEITDEDKEYINGAKGKDLRWTGKVLSTTVGSKAEDKNRLYYFVFATDHYYILEPVNQGNNATVIVGADTDVKELAKNLSNKNMSLDMLAESGEAIRVYHERDKDGEYNKNPNRLKLIAQVVSQTSQSIIDLRRRNLKKQCNPDAFVTMEELSEMAVSRVAKEDVPKISSYIKDIQNLPITSGISGSQLRRLREEIYKDMMNKADKEER